MNKLKREAIRLLKRSNLKYEIKDGTKHSHIYLEDKLVMVMNLNNGSTQGKDTKHLESEIRRRQKELLDETG